MDCYRVFSKQQKSTHCGASFSAGSKLNIYGNSKWNVGNSNRYGHELVSISCFDYDRMDSMSLEINFLNCS